MKNKILLSMMLISSITLSAQLKVSSEGKVGIQLADSLESISPLSIGNEGVEHAMLSIYSNGQVTSNPHYGLYTSMTNSTYFTAEYGIYSICRGKSLTKVGLYGDVTGAINSQARSYGVYGTAAGSSSGYNFGVYGLLTHGATYSYGAGVFGSNESTMVPCLERLGGYFRGKTRVVGDFYANSLNTSSDARLKTNVSNLNEDVLIQVNKLRPVQFNWKQTEIATIIDSTTIKMPYFSEDMEFDRTHYGFLAQDIQKLFPELVHEDEAGYLSVNYVELIPLLVQSIQVLSAEVEELKKTKENMGEAQRITGREMPVLNGINAVLYQNNPNPFSVDTKIRYELPEATLAAILYIYNMNGTQIAEYPINSYGEGSITITAGELDAGMYLYSLIADGQVVDTKRMILTK